MGKYVDLDEGGELDLTKRLRFLHQWIALNV